MDHSPKIFYIIAGAIILFYVGGRFLPRIISIIIGGFLSPLYYVAAFLGILGLIVFTGRWLLRR